MERSGTLNTASSATFSTRTHLAPKEHKTLWITFRGHSRSRVLGSLKSRYGCVLLYNSVGFRVGNFEATVRASTFSRTPWHSAPLRESARHSHKTHSFAFIFVADYVRIHSFFCDGLWKSNVLSKTPGTKTEFDMKQPYRIILGHSFYNHLQAGNRLLIAIY